MISEKHEEKFLVISSQRQVIIATSTEFINPRSDVVCDCGMAQVELVQKCVPVTSNIMLNNYTKLVNDKISTAKSLKTQRKLSTLTGKYKF